MMDHPAQQRDPVEVGVEWVAIVDAPVFTRVDLATYSLLTVVNVAAIAFACARFVAAAKADSIAAWLPVAVMVTPALLMWELRWFALPLMRRPTPLVPPAGLQVAVVTTFVPSAEPLSMLAATVDALVALDYPHDTWVLDEGDDPEVKQLCRDAGARHFSRLAMERYQTERGRFQTQSKHGNYNAWLQETGFGNYDVIATFDPDHIPVRHYLTRLLGYLRDPDVAFVQSPQLYYNEAASFIARGAAEETYAYYSSVQMAGYAAGFPVSIGCHTIHRASALRTIGGLPAHDGDDLAMTLLYLSSGWRGVYDPVPLAEGLTPVDWDGYLKQQRRWARSVLDLKLRLYPRIANGLPPRVRVAAGLHGLYYLSGLAIPLALAFICLLLVTGQHSTVQHVSAALPLILVAFVLMSCDFYRQRFFIRPHREIGIHWRAAVLRFAKWPWLFLALIDVAHPRHRSYEITMKSALSGKRPAAAPHLLTALGIAGAWLIGWLVGSHPSPLIEVAAAFLIAISLATAATSFRSYPPPYDAALVPPSPA